jgi:hypothetical protein
MKTALFVLAVLVPVYIGGQLIMLLVPGGLVIWPILFFYIVGKEFCKK